MPQPLNTPTGLPTCAACRATANNHLSRGDTTGRRELHPVCLSKESIPVLLKHKTDPIPESSLKDRFPKAAPGAQSGSQQETEGTLRLG